jgi:short-subunit dehydrogenase
VSRDHITTALNINAGYGLCRVVSRTTGTDLQQFFQVSVVSTYFMAALTEHQMFHVVKGTVNGCSYFN